MKYKCEMIRDLMPLCLDNVATKASKDTVIEHLSECAECKGYYDRVLHEPSADQDIQNDTGDYLKIAKKLRRKKLVTRIFITLVLFIIIEIAYFYALGYRLTAKSSAETSGRLNASSQLMDSYNWGNWEFFFYESANSYDIITSRKDIYGWIAEENWLVWPKYREDNGGVINAGYLYYWTDTDSKCGIQLVPVIAEDPNVVSLEVSVFGQTQTVEVETNKLQIITFENNNVYNDNETTGYAYDSNGNVIYKLITGDETQRWKWQKISK